MAYVWTEAESDEWETEKEDNDEIEENVDDNSMRDVFDNGDPKPSKKVKLDWSILIYPSFHIIKSDHYVYTLVFTWATWK